MKDYETFVLLYDINTTSNLEVPYETYHAFDFDLLCDDEIINEFRFYKSDIYKLNRF